MSLKQLQASLRLWKRRLAYREKRVKIVTRAAHKDRTVSASEAANIRRWRHLRDEAQRMVTRRRKQIVTHRPLHARAFAYAESLVGIMEKGGNNIGPEVSALIRSAGGSPGEPWCGDTVIVCYRNAGSKAVNRSWAAVRLMLTPGVKRTTSPVQGDIVRYTFDHTGLFDCWCDANGKPTAKNLASHLLAVEGNTGASGAVSDGNGNDGVYRKVRARSLVSDFLHVTR